MLEVVTGGSVTRDHKGRVPASALKNFVSECFDDAISNLVDHDPTDFLPEPEGFLENVENGQVRKWALEVHGLWRNLSRRVSGEVLEDRDLHSLLPLSEAVVMPSSRFREVYYWDTYWIIRISYAATVGECELALNYFLAMI